MKWVLPALAVMPLWAHDPVTTRLTYTRDISRLINRRCIGCHGSNASVPLASYEQARPWAKAIRDQVMTRKMPPWGAVPGFGPDLRGDPSLTTTEIDTVVRWVEGGAPEGDAALLPHTGAPVLAPLPNLAGPMIAMDCEWHAARDFTLNGIRSNAPLQMTLTRPDGAVLPVIWLRDTPKQPRDFVFAKPLPIPRGSVLRMQSSGSGGGVWLALSPAAASLRPPGKESRKQTPRCPAS